VTDKKMPAMVMEIEPTGTDLKVLVVGDVSGYPYHRKDLPLNVIIPEQYAPAAAVVTGAGLGILILLLEKLLSGFNTLISSSWDSVISYLSNHVSELFGEKEGQIRKVRVREEKIAGRRRYFLGLTAVEIGLAVLASILFGFANLFAARSGIDIGDVLIYVLVGGIAVVAHDIGHRVVASRYHLKTEYQFWGYGTILMLLTSWLFGAVFAQPARTIIEGEDKRGLALSFFTGPLISIILAFAFLVLLPLGGTLGTIGILGFTMNLVSGLYMLMPFYPMDGKKVMEWSWKYWGIIFIPLLIFYVVVMVMFV
jgi:Zn-dependent protease